MTYSKKGFTLIELLVVVLIIGILAAIAVPQYQKSVIKSRSAQMSIMSKSISDAIKIYYEATGKYPETFDELDLEIPSPGKDLGNPCDMQGANAGTKRNFNDYYIVMWPGSYVSTVFKTGKYKCSGFTYVVSSNGKPEAEKIYCSEHVYSEKGFCTKVMGHKKLEANKDEVDFYNM